MWNAAGKVELKRLELRRCWAVVNEWKPGKEVGVLGGSQERSMMCWAVENEGWQQQVSKWVEVFLWV